MGIRLVDTSTTSANGGTVGTAGTDRVDNVSISGTGVRAVPEPGSMALLGLGAAGMAAGYLRRRGSKLVQADLS